MKNLTTQQKTNSKGFMQMICRTKSFAPAFSLMEMMVVMLVVAVVIALSAPMVTKKTLSNAGSDASLWTGLTGGNVGYNLAKEDGRGIIIGGGDNELSNMSNNLGSIYATTSGRLPRLTINAASSTETPQIGFLKGGTATGAIMLGSDKMYIGGNSLSEGGGLALGYNTRAKNCDAIGTGSSCSDNDAFVVNGRNNVVLSASNTISLKAKKIELNIPSSGGQFCVYDTGGMYHCMSSGGGVVTGGHTSVAGDINANNAHIKGNITVGKNATVKGNLIVDKAIQAQSANIKGVLSAQDVAVSGGLTAGSITADSISASSITGGSVNGTSVSDSGGSMAELRQKIGELQNTLSQYVAKKEDEIKIVNEETVNINKALNTCQNTDLPNCQRTLRNYKCSCAPSDPNYTLALAEEGLVASDRRVKDIIGENLSAMDKINKLKVYDFTYKSDKAKTPHVGVIAQDLQKVFPNAVTKGKDGYLKIRQEDMFYAMVNALKELDAKIKKIVADVALNVKAIASHDAEIAKLKSKVEANDKRIDDLASEIAELRNMIEQKL